MSNKYNIEFTCLHNDLSAQNQNNFSIGFVDKKSGSSYSVCGRTESVDSSGSQFFNLISSPLRTRATDNFNFSSDAYVRYPFHISWSTRDIYNMTVSPSEKYIAWWVSSTLFIVNLHESHKFHIVSFPLSESSYNVGAFEFSEDEKKAYLPLRTTSPAHIIEINIENIENGTHPNEYYKYISSSEGSTLSTECILTVKNNKMLVFPLSTANSRTKVGIIDQITATEESVVTIYPNYHTEACSAAYNKDLDIVATFSSDTDAGIRIFDVSDLSNISEIRRYPGYRAAIGFRYPNSITFSKDNRHIYAISNSAEFLIIDLENPENVFKRVIPNTFTTGGGTRIKELENGIVVWEVWRGNIYMYDPLLDDIVPRCVNSPYERTFVLNSDILHTNSSSLYRTADYRSPVDVTERIKNTGRPFTRTIYFPRRTKTASYQHEVFNKELGYGSKIKFKIDTASKRVEVFSEEDKLMEFIAPDITTSSELYPFARFYNCNRNSSTNSGIEVNYTVSERNEEVLGISNNLADGSITNVISTNLEGFYQGTPAWTYIEDKNTFNISGTLFSFNEQNNILDIDDSIVFSDQSNEFIDNTKVLSLESVVFYDSENPNRRDLEESRSWTFVEFDEPVTSLELTTRLVSTTPTEFGSIPIQVAYLSPLYSAPVYYPIVHVKLDTKEEVIEYFNANSKILGPFTTDDSSNAYPFYSLRVLDSNKPLFMDNITWHEGETYEYAMFLRDTATREMLSVKAVYNEETDTTTNEIVNHGTEITLQDIFDNELKLPDNNELFINRDLLSQLQTTKYELILANTQDHVPSEHIVNVKSHNMSVLLRPKDWLEIEDWEFITRITTNFSSSNSRVRVFLMRANDYRYWYYDLDQQKWVGFLSLDSASILKTSNLTTELTQARIKEWYDIGSRIPGQLYKTKVFVVLEATNSTFTATLNSVTINGRTFPIWRKMDVRSNNTGTESIRLQDAFDRRTGEQNLSIRYSYVGRDFVVVYQD